MDEGVADNYGRQSQKIKTQNNKMFNEPTKMFQNILNFFFYYFCSAFNTNIAEVVVYYCFGFNKEMDYYTYFLSCYKIYLESNNERMNK